MAVACLGVMWIFAMIVVFTDSQSRCVKVFPRLAFVNVVASDIYVQTMHAQSIEHVHSDLFISFNGQCAQEHRIIDVLVEAHPIWEIEPYMTSIFQRDVVLLFHLLAVFSKSNDV